MKILGGHDYYDGAGWGVDETAVFVRNKEPSLAPHPFTMPKPIWAGVNDHLALTPGLAIVGAKILPFWEERRPAKDWQTRAYTMASGEYLWRTDIVFHFEPEPLTPIIDGLFKEKRRKVAAYNKINTHMALKLTSHQRDWMLEGNVTTLVLRKIAEGGQAERLEINMPTLKDIGLYKVLDPATTHMEINAWVSGVLPSSKPILTLSNDDRIAKAGFDKRSFRKDPKLS